MAGGIEDVTPNVQVEGLAEATEAFRSLGEQGAKAFDKISDAASKVGSASESIKKVTTEAEGAFNNMAIVAAESFGHILAEAAKGDFTGIATAIFGPIGGAAVKAAQEMSEFVSEQAELIETLDNLALATGMTTAEILGMREAFASVGISTSGFERSVARLAVTIANDWSQIQHSIRTSADDQKSAMLNVESAAFNVQKAYTALNSALSEAGRAASHDSLQIQEAALNLQRAQQALNGAALEGRQNALSVESAKLALIRAQMNLAKDTGQTVNPADEKALKIEQDKLAVKDAQLRVEQAQKKQQEEGLDFKAKQLAVEKAQLEVSELRDKQAEAGIKNAEKIRDAQLNIQKAQLARSETQEKMHEQELKDIPKIAQQIGEVTSGTREWGEVTNRTEISAANLSKAIIAAASVGGKAPDVKAVFGEMADLFAKMGTDADSMNLKLAILQQTMGAGFRSGQASGAQLLAIMARGRDTITSFTEDMRAFEKSVELKTAEHQVTAFNGALSQLNTATDVLKGRFAGILSVPLTAFFQSLQESIIKPEGSLNKLATSALNALEAIINLGTKLAALFGSAVTPLFTILAEVISRVFNYVALLVTAFNDVASALAKITGFDPQAFFGGMTIAVIALSSAFGGLFATMARFTGLLAGWGTIIGLVVQAVGNLVAAAKTLPTWLGGEGKSFKDDIHSGIAGQIEDLGKKLVSLSTMGLSEKIPGMKPSDTGNTGEHGDTKGAADALKQAGDKHATAASDLKSAGDKLATAGQPLDQAGQRLQDAGGAMASNVVGAADQLKSAASALSGAAQAIAAAAGKPVGKAATGGLIRGPGGPTDDTAGLFALSDGEYVVKSAAVSHYGAPLFEALNNLAVGGFATGGAVGRVRAPTAPAGSGPQSQSTINLSIDGHQFNGLRAPENVAAKLKTFAVGRQSSAAGKMPSWHS